MTAEGIRASRAAQAAANPVEPGADVPAFVFLLDGRALGYIGSIPFGSGMNRASTQPTGSTASWYFRSTAKVRSAIRCSRKPLANWASPQR